MMTFLGWAAALVLLYVCGSSAWHALRGRCPGQWACAGVWAWAAVVALAVLGAVGIAQAAVLAALSGGLAAAVAVVRRETPGEVLGDLGESLGTAFRRVRRAPSPAGRARDGAGATAPEAAVAAASASRVIPPVMADPALGVPPEPADLASASVPVPDAWAALAQWIAGREPEDDQELRMLADGDAAGALAVADARHAFAETCLNTIGLDPAYVAGVLETGDSMAEHASLLAQVHKRYSVIYGALKEWVGAHGPLPHKARDFLTGDM